MSKKDNDKVRKIDLDELGTLPELLDGKHHVIPIVTAPDELPEEVSIPEVMQIGRAHV